MVEKNQFIWLGGRETRMMKNEIFCEITSPSSLWDIVHFIEKKKILSLKALIELKRGNKISYTKSFAPKKSFRGFKDLNWKEAFCLPVCCCCCCCSCLLIYLTIHPKKKKQKLFFSFLSFF